MHVRPSHIGVSGELGDVAEEGWRVFAELERLGPLEPDPGTDWSFYLVERGSGRFARTVRLIAPSDVGDTKATLTNGELCARVPMQAERRGQVFEAAIKAASGAGTPRAR